MSPEQARGESSGCPSDIFSLGIILYELSCGRHPFKADSPMEVLRQIMSDDPPPPSRWRNDLPERLDALILRMLKKLPQDRPVAMEVEQELEEISKAGRPAAAGALVSARGISAPPVPARETDPVKLHPDDPARRGNGNPVGKYGFAVALILLIAGGGAFLFFSGKRESASVNSVAVMPFVNVSGDTNTQYLSDGLTESVIDSVSKLPHLKVLASSTVFSYRKIDLDPRKIGADLRVDAVMTGRVTHRGQAISTTAELVRVSDGSRIWGGEFNRPISDLIALKQDMAGEIADRLNRKLSGTTVAAHHSNPDNEAYRLYLLGRYYWHKRTEEAINTSIGYLEKALAVDRNFALAHSGMADALLIKATHADGLAAKALVDQAKAEAEKALAFDDTQAEAHATLGMIASQYYQWDVSKREFLRSIELNPNYATAHQWYAMMLLDTGSLEEGTAENRIAQDLDPLSIVITLNMANLYSLKNDPSRAHKEIGKARDIDPGFPLNDSFEGIVYMREHRYPEAMAVVRKAVKASDRSTFALGQLGWYCGLAGLTNEAKAISLELEKKSPDGSGNPGAMVFVALGLGDRDKVFARLKKALETHEFIPGILLLDPSFDSYRKDPRYAELLKTLGLKP
jgi:serine/threonine-protein kinase